MCLSTVFIDGQEALTNIAKVENNAGALVFTDLFGKQTFCEGKIENIDLMDNTIHIKKSAVNFTVNS